MPYRERDIEKLYWTVSEAAKELRVNESLIRFYDAELDLQIYRGSRKARKLSQDDMNTMRMVIVLSAYCHHRGIKKLIDENRLETTAEFLK